MNGWDIVGYAFDGAEYHAECIDAKLREQMNGSCAENECTSRDANGLCDANCQGYGPNPVFASDDDGCDGTCDVCGLPLVESDDTDDGDDDLDICADCEQPNDSNLVDGCHECVTVDEPGEEDYYLSEDERSIVYLGKRIVGPTSETDCAECSQPESAHLDVDGEYDADHEYRPFDCARDATMRALADYVREDKWTPNVWSISDHGNAVRISALSCGCYFTEHDGKPELHEQAAAERMLSESMPKRKDR